MTEKTDIELVIAQLLSNQRSSDLEELTEEQAKQLAKAAQGLRALDHLAGKQFDIETVDDRKTTQPIVDGTNPPTEQIGRFQIRETLGVGGHGLVFLAFDPKLEREVALKIPNMNAALDQESQQRFLRESRAAAVLSHPSIVPVFESGSFGPIHYIVYKFCPGLNLAAWNKLHAQQTTPIQAAKIIAQLSDAVEHAHQRGIVHRDLKPSNVLLESELNGEQLSAAQLPACLRIADFGLAKFVSDNTALTRTRGVVGTPDYMSPEQANGSPDVNAASDIYSLGAILYELLTGRPPHQQATLLATLKSVSHDPVIEPRKLNAHVSRDLDAICMKCLEKEVSNRYTSAFQLGEDLRAVINNRPVSVAKPTFMRRTEQWLRRNPILVRAAAVSAMISLIVLATALYWVNSARRDERTANQTAQANLQRAREIVKDFFVMTEAELAGLPGDSVIRKRLAERSVHYFEEFEQLVDVQDHRSREDLAVVRARLGRILDSDNQFKAAIVQFEKAENEFRELSQHSVRSESATNDDQLRYQYQIARIQVDLGSAHINLKHNETGRAYNKEALEKLYQLNAQHSEDWINDQLINALIDRSTVLSVDGETDEAQQVQQKALSLISARPLTQSLRRKQAFLFMEMAKTCTAKQDLQASIDHYQKAKSTFQELANHTKQNHFLNLMVVRCNVRIVGLQRRLGKPGLQSTQDQQDVVAQMRNLATANPERSVYQYEYALGLFDLALLYSEANQLKDAIDTNKELVQFIEATENRLGNLAAEGRAMLGGTYNNLASCYMQTEQHELAESAIRSAIPFTIEVLRNEPENLSAQRFLINHYYGLGEILTAQDRPIEAIAAFEKAIVRSEQYCSSANGRTSNHAQLHAILGKRLELLEETGLQKLQLDNLKKRIAQTIIMLESGETRFKNYYQRELKNDLQKFVEVLIEFHQNEAKPVVVNLLKSEPQRNQVQSLLLDALQEQLKNQAEPATAVLLEELRDIVEPDTD